jgi:hypothetical protein
MVHRPAMIRDQDKVEIRLTREAEYRLPYTFIEALNEGTLFDRPAHVFRDAARQHRLFHVVNRTTENILGHRCRATDIGRTEIAGTGRGGRRLDGSGPRAFG